ncbi:MAG TPA: sodium-dependent transporter [Lachnospiraceae bacterium]|nr:sodium-dependent transporter [Lachnospiraceae bacterium]
MQREKLGSRLGFILISAGCAIGIGNVWKFPYLCGQSGGGIFVLVYLFFLIILGLPAMTMEFAMGRASKKSPVKMYQELEPKGSKWHLHGILCMVGNYLLMMYYSTVAGWMLQYFVRTAIGSFENLNSEQVAEAFGAGLANPALQVGCMAIVVFLGFFVNAQGLQNGLEKVTKVMMIALLVIMVILAVNSIFLPGAGKGLEFYLLPSVERASEIGIFQVIANAMNQAFFTLSIGIGSMAIFGSYIDKDQALMGESINVILLDTFVAICSGLIIFPACFAYNVQPDSGPSLIFITLPNIFNNMKMGRLWGSLFFVFMTFAAFSTVLAVFENIMAMCMDQFGWSRKKAGYLNILIMLVLSLPCALGFNVLSGIQPLGPGSSILDFEDLLVSNYILPIGAFLFVLFCSSRYGWGWDNFVREANEGKGAKVREWMRPYVTYVLPFIVILVFILGII